MEAEGKMEKSAASLKQLANSANKNRVTRRQLVRRPNARSSSRRPLAVDSDDFGRRYQKMLSERRPYSTIPIRPVTRAYDTKRRSNNSARSIAIRRNPGKSSLSRSHDVSGFYTMIDIEALRRLFRPRRISD